MKKQQSRRRFLQSSGMVAISALVPQWGCDSNKVTFREMPTAPPMDMPPDTPMEEMPEARITPNSRFYLQSINGQNYDPKIDAANWSLRVDGLVDNAVESLAYEAITSMPLVRQTMTMQCIGNWIGGPLVGNAEWGGTPLSNLLDMAGVGEDAIRVKFYSVDDYTTSIPLERALREECLLVWEMNGEVLPSKHGFPVRLINPGHYGQKMPKWITRIELIDEVYLGYWESKPKNKPFKWSDDAIATINSRIDSPLSLWDDVKDPANGGVTMRLQTIRGDADTVFSIHGIAMAGERKVDIVEVSTDGGATWEDAQVLNHPRENVWTAWRYEWPLPPSGRYEIVARATDNAGDRQPAEDKGADLYDGRTGWHRVPIDVVRTEV
jgi:DMSO/TMAO reductase YedYZ molybdopterin-dependent catalytic subunit